MHLLTVDTFPYSVRLAGLHLPSVQACVVHFPASHIVLVVLHTPLLQEVEELVEVEDCVEDEVEELELWLCAELRLPVVKSMLLTTSNNAVCFFIEYP